MTERRTQVVRPEKIEVRTSRETAVAILAIATAALTLSTNAAAQTTSHQPHAPVVVLRPAAQQRHETPEADHYAPRRALIPMGIPVFGLPWLPSSVVSAESSHQRDGHLEVPFVGQRMGFADGGGVPDSSDHDTEVANRVVFAIDAFLQPVGALQIASAFLCPEMRYEDKSTCSTTRALKPEFRLTPMKLGRTGYGVGATGTF
jgi:hypothetical protein